MTLLDWLLSKLSRISWGHRVTRRRGDRARARAVSDEAVLLAGHTIDGFAEAREKWLEATQVDPSWSVPFFNIARSYLIEKNSPAARSFLKLAIICALDETGDGNEDSQVLEQASAILHVNHEDLVQAKEAGTLDIFLEIIVS